MDKVESPEKPKKSYLPAVFHSITAKVMPETAGIVKGIVYSKNKSSAVISDNNSILHEENTIHGATIVKIHKDKVEFAKKGQRWTQKVGETPGPEWYN
jgi:type II secretory pathway component PulC